MNLKLSMYMVCLFCLAFPGLSYSASEWTFNSSGGPVALVLGGENVLKSDSAAGFYLSEGRQGQGTRLTQLSRSGDKITVSQTGGSPSFTFQIKSYENHVAIHLLDVEGVGTGQDVRLSLRLSSEKNDAVEAYTLNDLMTARTKGQTLELTWPFLWARPRGDGSRGSVVFYDKKLTGKNLDAVLAEIWSAQAAEGHMVYPNVDSWTEADVLAWVDRWVELYSRLSVISVHPEESEEELYEMINQYVIPSGANRVYMFQRSWRESGMMTPRKNIFPKGKADMIAYRKYLEKHGIQLHLKSLSPQIKDAKYVSSDYVDPRIMSWVSGTLEEAIDSKTTTLRFRPDPASSIQVRDEEFVCVGNEVIGVATIKNTDQAVWNLEGCKRGEEGTSAKSHKAGSDMAGLVQSNHSFNFEEDFGMPNSLGEEICGPYGDFLNDVKTSHLHFDGTGRMHRPPWYVREFTDYVYSRVTYPTTGSIVGRGSLPAQFETKFSEVQKIYGMWAYHHMRIGIRLYEKGRKHTEIAPSKLDFHFDISDGLMNGTRRIELLGGRSGKVLTLRELDTYGFTDYSLKLFSYWQELGPVFADADAAYVRKHLTKRGNHYSGPDVLVLSKNSKGKFIFTPHRVMGRTSGKDEPFTIDQEWGAVPRWQKIPAGTTMELSNPYKTQPLRAMVWVEDSSPPLKDPLLTVNGSGTVSVKGTIQPTEYMQVDGGNSVTVYDKNWNLLRTLPATAKNFTASKGKLTVTTAAGSGTDKPNLWVQYITLGPEYVLDSNKYLAGQISPTK